MTAATTVRRVRNFPRETQHAYEGAHDRPLGGYLVAVGAYAGLTAIAAGIGRLRGSRLPARIDGRDVVLLGIATHRLSRMIAKDPDPQPAARAVHYLQGHVGRGRTR